MEGKGAERGNFFLFLSFSSWKDKVRRQVFKIKCHMCDCLWYRVTSLTHWLFFSHNPHIKASTYFCDHTCSSEDNLAEQKKKDEKHLHIAVVTGESAVASRLLHPSQILHWASNVSLLPQGSASVTLLPSFLYALPVFKSESAHKQNDKLGQPAFPFCYIRRLSVCVSPWQPARLRPAPCQRGGWWSHVERRELTFLTRTL